MRDVESRQRDPGLSGGGVDEIATAILVCERVGISELIDWVIDGIADGRGEGRKRAPASFENGEDAIGAAGCESGGERG